MSLDHAARWIWSSPRLPARAFRGMMLPASAAYGACLRVRQAAYRCGWLPRHRLPLPSVAVGNLSVGGTGKTPVAAWIARRLVARGIVPGILTGRRGVDEAQVHREQVPQAIVLQGADRLRAARQARQLGAEAIVLDDGFQRLGLLPDVKLLLLSAESAGAAPWLLPAGPWREPATAVRRADMVVVTRKRASVRRAAAYARGLRSHGVGARRLGVVHLRIGALSDLTSGEPVELGALRGARVMAVCGVAEPGSFAWQLGDLGAEVHIQAFPDHHAYTPADVRRLLSHRGHFGYVVVTHKDAVKLRAAWPPDAVPTLVAHLVVEWEEGEEQAEELITRLTSRT